MHDTLDFHACPFHFLKQKLHGYNSQALRTASSLPSFLQGLEVLQGPSRLQSAWLFFFEGGFGDSDSGTKHEGGGGKANSWWLQITDLVRLISISPILLPKDF